MVYLNTCKSSKKKQITLKIRKNKQAKLAVNVHNTETF